MGKGYNLPIKKLRRLSVDPKHLKETYEHLANLAIAAKTMALSDLIAKICLLEVAPPTDGERERIATEAASILDRVAMGGLD